MNQNLTHALMARAAAAERRMASLSRHQDNGEKTPYLKAALREIAETLEELRVATEQLELAADDLAVARQEATLNADRYREMYEALPLACVLTNEDGKVSDANQLASRLLNVAVPYLSGKPLLLYLPQRGQFFELLERVKSEGRATASVVVRPRDRKPVTIGLTVTALKHYPQCCWVFGEQNVLQESRTPVAGALPPNDHGVN